MHIIANELIPVYEEDGKQAVNTRDLHEFLEVGKDYSTWFKYRADQNGYSEGEDFTPILGKSTGGRPTTDYIVSIETAKEIAMMENNDKGREVRRYFIEIEKRYKMQVKPMTPAELIAAQANLLVDHERRLAVTETKVDHMIDAITDLAQLDWAADMNRRINGLCKTYGLNYQTFRSEMYLTLESTAHCDIKARKNNLQGRMKQAGQKYKDIMAVTKLQVIADDPKLRAIFEGIVRTQQFKYAGRDGEAS